jgi:site-specific DNA-methyltransferase (adenine-specific)
MAAGRSCGHPWLAVDALVPIPRAAPPISLAAARTALAQATDLATVASVIDRLEVLRVAARKARQSLDAQNDWAVLKLEAERKAGGMLTDLRARGDLRPGRPNADTLSALSELTISQQQSSRWQRLAAVPDERFTRWVDETRARDDEVTEAGLFAVATRIAPNRAYGPLNITPLAAPGCVPRNVLLEGDCLPILRTLPDACVDALVTDPPAAIGFMGAEWDTDRGGRDAWVAWMTEVMRECLRVLKPGAHGLVWALPRTSHWTAWALEEAGFEIRDSVLHVFAQGWPKSFNVADALDGRTDPDIAERWEGHGSALKPAHEVWWLVRKPLSGTLAENVLRYGTGTLNIDGCRIPFTGAADAQESKDKNRHADFGTAPGGNRVYGDYSMVPRSNYDPPGRWPSDVILSDPVFDGDYPEEVVGGGQSEHAGSRPSLRRTGFWADKPPQVLEGQRMELGGKSRFFLIPKASRHDRNGGLDGEIELEPREWIKGAPLPQRDIRPNRPNPNNHIACKPLHLIRHLVRLTACPGALVLDPFAGSGTTGLAAHQERCDYLLIEQDPDSVDIARARLGSSLANP